MREIWERADASVPDVSPDDYSLQAVTKELTQRGLAFRDVFAQFAIANRLGDYVDAETADYPVPPRTAAFGVGPRQPGGRLALLGDRPPGRSLPLLHPGRLGAADVEAAGRGEAAEVRRARDRRRRASRRHGHGAAAQPGSRWATRSWSVAFGRGVVKRVEVALSNGSTRVGSCWIFPGRPSTSCMGRPLDDNRAFQLRAQLIG